jgi:hypothetical protein
MNGCMGQGVRITTTKQVDARCIANALLEYGGEITQDGKGWAVQLSAPEAPELTAS